MIENLPIWNCPNLKPAFNDLESATAMEMVYKLYGKNRELIDDYNKFLTDIQNEVTAFKESTNQDYGCFKEAITKICNDYIKTMDMKIDCQDRKIADAIQYMKDNLVNTIKELNDNNELDNMIVEAISNVEKELYTQQESYENKINSQVRSLASGTPLVANSVSEMIDTNKVYVNTTDGYWYYYNGTEWLQGGMYQAIENADGSINIDKLEYELQKTVLRIANFPIKDIEYPGTTVYQKDGATGTYNCWWSSDFVELKSIYKAIKIDDVACLNNSTLYINAISFFDSDKNYISGIDATNNNVTVTHIVDSETNKQYDSMNGFIEIPSNAKYCIFTQFDNYAGFKSKNKICFTSTTEETTEMKINKMYPSFINQNIKNVLCIGDSLTEGDSGSEPAGTKNIITENYPYFLAKYLNCNVTNEGYCGLTPYQYWTTKAKNIDFSKNYDVIVIMLGTNHALTDTIENDTNISDGETYENYVMTETGSYCAMIEYIMEQTNNKSQIILCCPPHVGIMRPNNREHAINTNPIIKKVGEKYSLPVIDLLNEGGFSDYNQNIFQPIDHLHFNDKGYQKMATFIGSKIKSLFSYFE